MIRRLLISFVLSLFFIPVAAQSINDLLNNNRTFAGAEGIQEIYRVIFQLDSNDSTTIAKTFRNLNNALKDPRLSGKLEVELIAFSGGTDAFMKNNSYGKTLKDLIVKGVIVAQCANTLKERNIERNELYDFIGLVPSGVGELIIRQAEGWVIIKP